MSALILPGQPGWFGMVSPREEEMPEFLKVIAQGWRTPKRKWEDLWRLRRGELNHVLGMRKFGLPKYQRGSVGITVVANAAQQGAGGTIPNLQNVTESISVVAPNQCRIVLAYDSDGSLQFDSRAGNTAAIVYAKLTTQSDDANDHTNDWWPDQPETNEGLNWDIRFSANTQTGSGGGSAWHLFKDNLSVDRTINVWYLLDTVSNDHADGTINGCWGVGRNNGTAKSPVTGTTTNDGTVEIRATGVGSAVASHVLDFTAIGT